MLRETRCEGCPAAELRLNSNNFSSVNLLVHKCKPPHFFRKMSMCGLPRRVGQWGLPRGLVHLDGLGFAQRLSVCVGSL